MAMTFHEEWSRFTDLTKDNSSTNQTRGKAFINDKENEIASLKDWTFLDKERTATSVASQQQYRLPVDYDRLLDFWTVVGGVTYYPDEVTDLGYWSYLNGTSTISDITTHFTIIEDYIYLYPTPSSTSVALHLFYHRGPREMSVDDYTTGTLTVAAASRTVNGSGTTWTSAMANRWIKINGLWYEIESVSSTTQLTLAKASHADASGATYKIGEMSVLPKQFHDLLWKGTVADYLDFKGNENPWRKEYELRLAMLLKRYGGRAKSAGQVMRRTDRGARGNNPNDYPSGLTG